ncbi:MAG: glycosyltransferase family 1 protein [Rhizobiaceae bacterium]|nr:glycosyltransferase family 1 protein [Rhizobiaceae bacterium]
MRIGIDARNLLSRRTGIGRSVHQIGKQFCAQGHEVTFFWPEKPQKIPAGLEAAEHHFSHNRGPLSRIAWSQTQLTDQINANQPDVFWGPSHRLPARLGPSIPCVVTIHDMVWAKYPQTMRWSGLLADRFFAPHAMRRADTIIAVSQSTKHDIVERYPHHASKTHVIYPGVSDLQEDKYGTAEAVFPGPAGAFALFVGTLEPRKNLSGLLHAMAMLKNAGQLTGQLCIAGGQGWRHANLGAMIRDSKLQDHVTATGYVDDAVLDRLYRQARFLIMPSLYEGFGIPIIEANHYGIPVLTSNISSMPEAAGNAGLLVDPLDPDDIAKKWQSLWNDERLYSELAAKARPNAARFSWQESAARMETLFEQLIADTR